MMQSNPPLPQPQLEPAGITFDQYAEYTRLEAGTEKRLLGLWWTRPDWVSFSCPDQHGAISRNPKYRGVAVD